MSIFGDKIDAGKVVERLAAVDDALASLERRIRSQELEYIELYDKVKRQMSRMAKRYAVDQKENGEQELEEVPDDGLDPISRSIMLRRGLPRTKR